MSRDSARPLTVAVVGATGVVGRTMIQVLLERALPGRRASAARLRPLGRHDRAFAGARSTVGEATPGGVRRAWTSRSSRPAADVSRELAPEAAARGCTVIDNSSAWRMEPGVPLVVSQVNPDDARGPRGDHRQPELLARCSSCRPDGPARRGRASSASSSTRTRPSPARAQRRSRSWRRRSGPTSRASRRSRASTRTRSPSTRCPEIDVFLDNGYTKEEWKVVTESRKILHLPDLRVSCTAVRVPGLRQPLGGGPRRDPRARSRPDEARELFAAVPGVVVRGRSGQPTSTRSPPRPPARDEIYVGPGPARTPRSRTARPRLLGRLATTCARAPPRTPWRSPRSSSRAAGSGAALAAGADARPGRGVTEAERRAALEAIAAEVRACTRCRLHERPDTRRARRGAPRARRSSSWARARAATRTARAGRSWAAAGDLLVRAARLDRLAARGRLHHQRREVPAAGQPRPGAGRDRRLRALPATPAGGPRPGARRDAGPPLDGAASCPGTAISRAHGTVRPADPATGAPRRARLRDVPPGGGPAPRPRSRRRCFADIAARPGRARRRPRAAPAAAPASTAADAAPADRAGRAAPVAAAPRRAR